MPTPKEAIYDEQVCPLMAQIIEICNSHKIAMLAQFALGVEEDSDSDSDQLLCSTWLLDDAFQPTKEQLQAARILKPSPPPSASLVVRDGDGKVKSVTSFLP